MYLNKILPLAILFAEVLQRILTAEFLKGSIALKRLKKASMTGTTVPERRALFLTLH